MKAHRYALFMPCIIACGGGYGESKPYPGPDPGVPTHSVLKPAGAPSCCNSTCGACIVVADPFGGGSGGVQTPTINYGFEDDGVLNWDVPLGVYVNGANSENYLCALNRIQLRVANTSSYWAVVAETDLQWHFVANAAGGDIIRVGVHCANGYTNPATQNSTGTWGQLGDFQAIGPQGGATGTLVESGFNDAYDTAFFNGAGGVIAPNSTGVGVTTIASPAGHSIIAPEMIAIPSSTSGDTALGIAYSFGNFPCYPGKTEGGCQSTHPSYSGLAAAKKVGPLFGETTTVTLASHTDTKQTLCGFAAYYGPSNNASGGPQIDYNADHTVTMTSLGNAASATGWCIEK